jgi:hypothetical protein
VRDDKPQQKIVAKHGKGNEPQQAITMQGKG